MFEKIKTYQQKIVAEIHALQDVRVLGMLMFLVVALLISWSGIKVIETNYQLQKEIAQARQKREVGKLENRNLELENKYFETDEYLELEARKNFGLAAPGETVFVVPKQVAMKYVDESKLPASSDMDEASNKPTWQKNMQAWLGFLFNRS